MTDNARHFTDEELESAVYEDTGKIVRSKPVGESRWQTRMEGVVKMDDDGKYYRITWYRGNTEMQENEYYSGDFPEVHPVEKINATVETEFMTADEAESYSEEESLKEFLRLLADRQLDLLRKLEDERTSKDM
ncbi:hypothetical protein [Bifidobacterium callitrichidarum]|uniref:Uncharacterized protein n=1 Tax=Bifidobacterium callitrichidarum TaxID=2052941 RepID=A0A2U2N974_9BIFI|nr:hypothetical protein [Bifidobacterium callitrichidarum]PWG65642.1 hypothetical protein DF196_06835 [Bifidobacterium callitrichidarum]